MTAPNIVDPSGLLAEALTDASPNDSTPDRAKRSIGTPQPSVSLR